MENSARKGGQFLTIIIFSEPLFSQNGKKDMSKKLWKIQPGKIANFLQLSYFKNLFFRETEKKHVQINIENSARTNG